MYIQKEKISSTNIFSEANKSAGRRIFSSTDLLITARVLLGVSDAEDCKGELLEMCRWVEWYREKKRATVD